MAYADILRAATRTRNDEANLIDGLIPAMVNNTYAWGGTSTGSGNVQAITCAQAPAGYSSGQVFYFQTGGFFNSGATTLNVNGLGAVPVYDCKTNAALIGGELPPYYRAEVLYITGYFFLMNGVQGAATWSPTVIGFSTPPSMLHRFSRDGRRVSIDVWHGNGGVSNSNVYTISLPITAANTGTNILWMGCGCVKDNGVWLSKHIIYVGQGASTVTLNTEATGAGFTASGEKGCAFSLTYEV